MAGIGLGGRGLSAAAITRQMELRWVGRWKARPGLENGLLSLTHPCGWLWALAPLPGGLSTRPQECPRSPVASFLRGKIAKSQPGRSHTCHLHVGSCMDHPDSARKEGERTRGAGAGLALTHIIVEVTSDFLILKEIKPAQKWREECNQPPCSHHSHSVLSKEIPSFSFVTGNACPSPKPSPNNFP